MGGVKEVIMSLPWEVMQYSFSTNDLTSFLGPPMDGIDQSTLNKMGFSFGSRPTTPLKTEMEEQISRDDNSSIGTPTKKAEEDLY
ncbi:hypothetical protein HK100_012030 [Physocladia obscura]|uniref:Uncharacterized protein n=1 Tax=Physocladia obscura TaxID=109957 RepID=A0AAD5XG78_9FUNG|nr:hypothetical protein HK100_012030 [Physocladia obscura]